MRRTTCPRILSAALAAVCLAGALPVLAADASGQAVGTRDMAAISQSRNAVQAAMGASRIAALPPGGGASELFANPDRAYPPSCLNAPLTTLHLWQNDPNALQAQVKLIGDPLSPNTNEQNYSETDTITVFRVVCSSGKSATLLEIDRPANLEGNTTLYPTFPGVSVTQGGNSVAIRVAEDPNTFLTTVYSITPVFNSTVYVLENYYGATIQFDYNAAFTLLVDNFISNSATRVTSYNVAAYNKNNYAESTQALPISGYMSSNWFDPAHGGEGTLTQIFENADGTRTFTSAWYTFDKSGLPFWLYSQGVIPVGARTTGNVQTFYATGGGFAGAFTSATFTPWGTINFSFPDCDHMDFTYAGQTDAQTNGPGGSGSRRWLRIANVNGLTCK